MRWLILGVRSVGVEFEGVGGAVFGYLAGWGSEVGGVGGLGG